MRYTIKIEENLLNYLEALMYECDRTKEIVAYMLGNNYDVSSKAFQQWDKDNQKAYIKFAHAKDKVTNEIIPHLLPAVKDKAFTWNADFYGKQVIVDVQEN